MALLTNLPIRLHVKNRHPFELQAPKASTVSAIRVPNDLNCFANALSPLLSLNLP